MNFSWKINPRAGERDSGVGQSAKFFWPEKLFDVFPILHILVEKSMNQTINLSLPADVSRT